MHAILFKLNRLKLKWRSVEKQVILWNQIVGTRIMTITITITITMYCTVVWYCTVCRIRTTKKQPGAVGSG